MSAAIPPIFVRFATRRRCARFHGVGKITKEAAMAETTSDFRGFNTPPAIETKDHTARIVGAVVIVLALASAGAYSFETGMWHSGPKRAVPMSQLPSPTPPQTATQAVPALPPAANNVPAQPVSAPTQSVVATPATPVVTTTTTQVRTERMHVVTHPTPVVHRTDTTRERRIVPDRNDVAPQNNAIQNNAVTPEDTTPNSATTPQIAAPTNTTPQTPAPSAVTSPSQTAAPSQPAAPSQMAAPAPTAPSQAAPSQPTTPNSSTPNGTDPPPQ
jgi:hypothetical protein